MDAKDLPAAEVRLTPLQVEHVVRQATGWGQDVDGFLGALLGVEGDTEIVRAELERDGRSENPRLSRSVLRGVYVLAGVGVGDHAVTELAKELGMNASTTLRYIQTWVALGLLEQDPASQRYRRARR